MDVKNCSIAINLFTISGVLKSIFSQEELSEILDCDQSRLLRRQSTACSQPDKLDQVT